MTALAPPDRGRALFWACAIACFLAAASALFARAAATAAQTTALEAASGMTVRVLAPQDPGAAERAAEALRRAPDVLEAASMSAERIAQLSGRWGAGVSPETLADLRLIEARAAFKRVGDPLFAAELEAALAKGGFEAEVLTAGPAANEALIEAERVRKLSLWALAGAGVCAALIVGLVAFGRAAARRAAVELLAELGATKAQAASPFAEEAAGSAFAAGVVGAAAAAAATAALLPAAAPGLTLADMISFAGPLDFAPLAATPLLSALSAGLGARFAAAAAYETAGGEA